MDHAPDGHAVPDSVPAGGAHGRWATDGASSGNGWSYGLGLVALALAFFCILLAWVMLRPMRLQLGVTHDGGWDRLALSVELVERGLVGSGQAQPAQLTRVTVRNVRGEVLFQGNGARPTIEDALLESEEPLRVEACAQAMPGGTEYCATQELSASRKRIVLANNSVLHWPLTMTDLDRGEARLGLLRQRELFGQSGGWESIGEVPTGKVRVKMVLEGGSAGNELGLELPADGRAHSFLLTQGSQHSAFRAALDQALADGQPARVNVSLLLAVATGQAVVSLGSQQRLLRRKTPAQRQAEVERCVQLIAERVVKVAYGGGDAIGGNVRGNWSFDDAAGRYTVDMDVGFAGMNSGIAYKLSGRAMFGDGGERAEFILESEDFATNLVLKKGGSLLGKKLGWKGRTVGDLRCDQ